MTLGKKIMKVNDMGIKVGGTHLLGYMNASYDMITNALGYPLEDGFDNMKSDAEWHIEFDDGAVATIYNYKNGKNYLGEHGYHVCDIPQWHIGGRSADVVSRVVSLIPDAVEV